MIKILNILTRTQFKHIPKSLSDNEWTYQPLGNYKVIFKV